MKDQAFIEGMRKAGKLAARVLDYTCKLAVAGVTTNDLDRMAHEYTIKNGGTNACLGYQGYPKSICTSINEVLCHGVPSGVKLKVGDIVNIDVTVKVGPYHGDTSRTVVIGQASVDALRVVEAAHGAMMAGIRAVRPHGRTGDIGHATQTWLRVNYPDMAVCKDIGGHGIGKIFHDTPHVPGVGMFGTGDVIRPWKCITVEPIVMLGVPEYHQHDIAPLDGHSKCNITEIKGTAGLAAQFEHTVLVTHLGYEILTELP